MGRGLLSGFIWGAVVSILVLGVASLFAPPPVERSGTPAQDRMEMPAGSAFNREKPDTDPVLPVPDLPVDGEAAQPAAPDDEVGAPPVADTAPAAPPEVVQSVEPQAPAPGPVEPAPIAPGAEDSAPAIPEGALGVPVPDVEIPMPGGDDTGPAALPDVPQPPSPDEDPVPEAPAEDVVADATEDRTETAVTAPQPAPETAPEAPASPAGQPAEDAEETAAAPEPEPGPAAAPEPEPAAEPAAPEAEPEPAPAAETAEPARPTLGALSRHSVAFENPQGRPLMSLILVDAPDDGLDIDVLKTFNFPVTFALDPARADAPARAAVLRDAGFEVIALTPEGQAGLPPNAGPGDVDRALTAFFERIDRGVALLDRPKDGFQRTAPVAEAVIARFEETGHGLLTFDDGLNTTRKKAARAGVPAATVFRMLDAEAERTPKIKRYLDRAAYKAREDGWVIMVGRSFPDTVRALFEWALSEEAETVELAPVSAVLRLMR